jgi:hypothetical protein
LGANEGPQRLGKWTAGSVRERRRLQEIFKNQGEFTTSLASLLTSRHTTLNTACHPSVLAHYSPIHAGANAYTAPDKPSTSELRGYRAVARLGPLDSTIQSVVFMPL